MLRGRDEDAKRPPNREEGGAREMERRFPDRGGPNWVGPLVDYIELEFLRKFLTTSCKLMSRKRAGTNAQEQKQLKLAVKRARFMGLVPYSGY